MFLLLENDIKLNAKLERLERLYYREVYGRWKETKEFRKIKTSPSKRDADDYRLAEIQRTRAFRKELKTQRKLARKREQILRNKAEYYETIFELAMIPLSYRDRAFIATKEGEEGLWHIYIGKKHESITEVLHGHVVVDSDGKIHYARWPGEERGAKNYIGGVDAEEYYQQYLDNEENENSDLYLNILYSKLVDFQFPIPEEELEIPEIPEKLSY